ncbi:aspartyl protease family protein 2-like [Malus sylvestris]|uniref:aspartyl protease family protein 2-like n=1 Tax=Malus sylvestris TaxID=3752 RepID=UPI0021AC5D21|nr:aspartyl protease family protein 2-like [Malus sylvestris]
MSSSLCQNTSGITAPVKRSFNGFFYVELWIGTPPVRANVAIVTGSDLTWVQSADCTKCFPVALPIYDGMKLATYIAMSPHHPLCPDPSPFGHNDTCTYETTPIFGRGGHYVQLKGISLNEGLLPIDPKLLAKPISATVIDSGTERRFIIAKAYVVLERAVISYFQDSYGWKPMKNTSKRVDSDLCYKIHRGGRYEFPKLTLHFENEYIDLDRRSSFKEYTRENQFCMTILPIDDNMQNNVLEACQHANHRFLFDVADLKLSFATESC